MKTDLIKQFNLPGYVKGKSFAQASKLIDKKFKDRTDKISNETKQELLERLSQAQEFIKMQSQEAPTNQMRTGGRVPVQTVGGDLEAQGLTELSGAATPSADLGEMLGGGASGGGPGPAGYIGAATTAFDLGKDMFSKSDIDVTGETRADKVDVAGKAVGSAAKGAQAGMAFGPWGAAIGGVVGGVSGLISGGKDKRAANEANHNNTLKQSMAYRPSNFALGGYTDPTDPKESKRISLPEGENRKIAYANQKKLSVGQLGGFEDQQITDEAWRNKRDSYISDNFAKWRSGMTGATPHDKYSQTAPEYQAAMQNIKDTFYKENPRKINSIVQDYAQNGPAGTGKGQTFGSPQLNTNMLKNNEAYAGNQNTDFGYGGKMSTNKYAGTDPFSSFLTNIDFNKIGKGTMPDFNSMTGTSEDWHNPKTMQFDIPQNATAQRQDIDFNAGNYGQYDNAEQTGVGKALSKGSQAAGKFLKNNYGSILRYAPLLGNLTNKLDRPNTPRGTRLDNVYSPQLFDEARLVNQVNQNNVDRALTESSGGDLGALRKNLIGSNLAKLKATSDAYFKGNEQNRAENRFKFQSDLRKDTVNANLDRDYLNRKAADEGAYNTAKLANRNAIFEDIGKVGKEETYKKMVKEMFGYTWNGKYWTDQKGNKVDDATVRAQIKSTKDGDDK